MVSWQSSFVGRIHVKINYTRNKSYDLLRTSILFLFLLPIGMTTNLLFLVSTLVFFWFMKLQRSLPWSVLIKRAVYVNFCLFIENFECPNSFQDLVNLDMWWVMKNNKLITHTHLFLPKLLLVKLSCQNMRATPSMV